MLESVIIGIATVSALVWLLAAVLAGVTRTNQLKSGSQAEERLAVPRRAA